MAEPLWRSRVNSAVADATVTCLGHQGLEDEMLAGVLIRLLAALQGEQGLVFVDPMLPEADTNGVEIVVYRAPSTLALLAVRDWQPHQIRSVDESGTFTLRIGRSTETLSPFEELARYGQTLQTRLQETYCLHGQDWNPFFAMPQVMPVLVLPLVSQNDWQSCVQSANLGFPKVWLAEDLEDSDRIRAALCGSDEPATPDPEFAEMLRFTLSRSNALGMVPRVSNVTPGSLGHEIEKLFQEPAALTEEQLAISREPLGDGPRLIRGVAGSGKTVLMALMAARYLYQQLRGLPKGVSPLYPPKILVTCFNRSLVPFIYDKIEKACQDLNLNVLPADYFHIVHIDGLASGLGRRSLLFIPPNDVEERAPEERFRDYAAQLAKLKEQGREDELPRYDLVMVDEGQDLTHGHIEFLLQLVARNPRTGEPPLVIYYDDAQNIYGNRRPVWKQLGLNLAGRRSMVMTQCHRNTREIAEFAYNVLVAPRFGRSGLRGFADVQTLTQRGVIREEDGWFHVGFAPRRGPLPVLRHVPQDGSCYRIARRVRELICEEGVQPHDILVLATTRRSCDRIVKALKSLQLELGLDHIIQPYGKHPDRDGYILRPKCLTVSTVHGAKGYEAPVVLFDLGSLEPDEPQDRALFYVAVTRARLYLEIFAASGPFTTMIEQALLELSRRLGVPASTDLPVPS